MFRHGICARRAQDGLIPGGDYANLCLAWNKHANYSMYVGQRYLAWHCVLLGQKKKLLCCPLPTDRKMRKNRVVFFFIYLFIFFFLCQIWAKNLLKFVFNGLKKHLHDLYMRFDCIPPEFSPFRNFKKNIGKLSLTVRKKKKKKKKNPDRPTQFLNFGRVRAT